MILFHRYIISHIFQQINYIAILTSINKYTKMGKCISIGFFILLLFMDLSTSSTIDPSTKASPTQAKKQLQKYEHYLSRHSEIRRLQEIVFNQNFQDIQQHNRLPNKTYEKQLNQFAFVPADELQRSILTLIPSSEATINWFNELKKEPKLGNSGVNLTQPEKEAADAAKAVENQVIKILRKHLQDQGLSPAQINAIIAERTYSENISSNNSNTLTTRFLQTQPLDQGQSLDDSFDVDWTCVSGNVRNQGLFCGSCYAFASVDTFSMSLAIYGLQFSPQFSVQDIISCSQNSMTLGCRGGLFQGAFQYISKQGLVLQAWYPYSRQTFQSGIEGPCKILTEKENRRFRVQTVYHQLQKGCTEMRSSLLKQPIAIGISSRKLFSYASGIFEGCLPSQPINHAVVLVAYQKGKGWKIKNSWGKNWGEQGYAWLADGNSCHICQMGFYAQPGIQEVFFNYLIGNPQKTCK